MTRKPHLSFTVLTRKTWPKIYLSRKYNYRGGVRAAQNSASGALRKELPSGCAGASHELPNLEACGVLRECNRGKNLQHNKTIMRCSYALVVLVHYIISIHYIVFVTWRGKKKSTVLLLFFSLKIDGSLLSLVLTLKFSSFLLAFFIFPYFSFAFHHLLPLHSF